MCRTYGAHLMPLSIARSVGCCIYGASFDRAKATPKVFAVNMVSIMVELVATSERTWFAALLQVRLERPYH